MHGHRDAPEHARECFEEALSIFQHLEARSFIDRTERVLEGLR